MILVTYKKSHLRNLIDFIEIDKYLDLRRKKFVLEYYIWSLSCLQDFSIRSTFEKPERSCAPKKYQILKKQ